MLSRRTLIPESRLRRRIALPRMIGGAFLTLQGTLALSTGYLLTLLFAARSAAHSSPSKPLTTRQPTRLRFVVLVPAHDEQNGIADTLASLAICSYPVDRVRTVVIADNCTDRTADRARQAGVEVWERDDPSRCSKGFALAWALERLEGSGDEFDVVVILDADCLVSSNMLSAMEDRVRSGASVVQVSYEVANPAASYASALRFAGFALTNTVRPLGKQRLGLSCGLLGTGMAFTRELLCRAPWSASGLVEDGEYHLHLIQAGARAEFAPGAWVRSAMPTSFTGSSSQQARWEYGRLQLASRWSPRLVGSGLVRRDIVRVHAGLECLVPPQSLIAVGSLVSTLAGLLLGSRRLVGLSAVTLVAQLGFVLAGLRLLRAPAQVYRALLVAPVLIAGKVMLYGRLLAGRSPTTWVRTEREA